MANYLCIDSGTTNTRIALVCNNQLCDIVKYNIGATKSIDGNEELKSTIKTGISDILNRNNLSENNITAILASGMITSKFGLAEIPHILVPVGIYELKQNIKTVSFKEISSLPINFIPGVKINSEDPYNADIMRGEETELMGLLQKAGLYVFPGSHNKIIRVNDLGQIETFESLLTGEMISAISNHTILRDVLDISKSELETKLLLEGYIYAKNKGLGKALFQVRVLKEIGNLGLNETYNFFIGAVLCDDIEKIISMNPSHVYVGGNKLKEAIVTILKNTTHIKTTEFSNKECESAVAIGMVKIFEKT